MGLPDTALLAQQLTQRVPAGVSVADRPGRARRHRHRRPLTDRRRARYPGRVTIVCRPLGAG